MAGGRPTKLEDTITLPGPGGSKRQLTRREAVLELIRQGCTHRVAALRAGISESTFYNWRERGSKAKRGRWREFYDELLEAEAVAEAMLTLRMTGHARTDWRACAWMLERRFPDTWRQRQTVDATVSAPAGQAPAAVIVGVASMDREQLAALSGCNLDDLDGLQLPTEVGPGPAADTDTDTDEDPDHDRPDDADDT
jgi:hypothetical protein